MHILCLTVFTLGLYFCLSQLPHIQQGEISCQQCQAFLQAYRTCLIRASECGSHPVKALALKNRLETLTLIRSAQLKNPPEISRKGEHSHKEKALDVPSQNVAVLMDDGLLLRDLLWVLAAFHSIVLQAAISLR